MAVRAPTRSQLVTAAFVLVLAVPFGCAWLFGASERAHDAALAAYWQGEALYDQGRYAEAIDCYRVYKELQDRRGENSSEVTGRMGYAAHLAGQPTVAEALLREALAHGPRRQVYVYQAHFLAKHPGLANALAWIDGSGLGEQDRLWVRIRFLRERGDHAAALPNLHELLSALAGRDLLSELDTVTASDLDRGRHASLLQPLREVADSLLQVGDLNRADAFAALGVAIGQQRDHLVNDSDGLTAGDVGCRLLRARVAMARGAWDAAAEHVRLAEALAGPLRQGRDVAAVRAELDRQRPPR